MIKRKLQRVVEKYLFKGKIIILTGARQVGKTTLALEMARSSEKRILFWNCDEPDVEQFLDRPSSTELKHRIGDAELLVIDEAQRIREIGITLKLIADNLKQLQVIVTGSSALGLHDSIHEPLTGRKLEFQLHPFSFSELVDASSETVENRLLEQRLIYGMYPEPVLSDLKRDKLLTELAGDYLYKDILSMDSVRKPSIIPKLLQALALQITNEVSLTELGEIAGCDRNTVIRYLDLLEKAFVIYTLPALSRNQRNEIKKGRKIYFWDNGIRNALINQFNPMSLRADKGKLWENFMVGEIIKKDQYEERLTRHYFWRNHQQQEIDLIRETGGTFDACEFKWTETKANKVPGNFIQDYPASSFTTIHPKNFGSYLL
ncbi:MAG: ATP-binding protein [Bacteroidales bacterium]|nr:ATP-binding protein [Bacteroidales bacterium]